MKISVYSNQKRCNLCSRGFDSHKGQRMAALHVLLIFGVLCEITASVGFTLTVKRFFFGGLHTVPVEWMNARNGLKEVTNT